MGVNCASNCIRCSQKNSSVCLECLRDTDVMINVKCTTKCPNQYYYFNHTTDSCQPCLKGCRLCTQSNKCIDCETDYILNSDGGQCFRKIASL